VDLNRRLEYEYDVCGDDLEIKRGSRYIDDCGDDMVEVLNL
jgi:hypothetical protein